MSKNKQPSRKEIQNLIDGFRIREKEAQAELAAADTAQANAKRAEIENQNQGTVSKRNLISRAPVFFLEETKELKDLKHERGRAGAKLADIQRRLQLLVNALRMTPE